MLRVPEDYPTVTPAANIAVAGDTVLVSHPEPPQMEYENETVVIKPGVSVIGIDHSGTRYVGLIDSSIRFDGSPSGDSGSGDAARLEWIGWSHTSVWSDNPLCEIRHCYAATGITCNEGGLVEYNWFQRGGTPRFGVRIIQGVATVQYNLLVNMEPGVYVDSDYARQPAAVGIRNNTWQQSILYLFQRPDSSIDIVNNLFLGHGGIPDPRCPGTTFLRYNDFVDGFSLDPSCTPGVGNLIGVDPMLCEQYPSHPPDYRLQPDSPIAHAGERGAFIGAFGVGCGNVGVEEAGSPAAGRIVLGQNRPNPFNPRTWITFELPAAGPVSLEIYSAAGHLVRTLVRGHLPAKRHEMVWDGRDAAGRPVASGVYDYQLAAGGETRTRAMILLR